MPLQFPMTHDAMQSSLVFVQSQAARINAEVYRIQYRQVRYRGLVPVDTTGPEWLDSIVFYSIDGAGRAEWLNSGADDVPKVALQMGSTVAKVGLAGIGYDFTTEEVARAQALGINLTNEKANVARRGAEQMIDRIVWSGDPQKGITGIINNPNVAVVDAAATGTGSSTRWANKTPGQILADINSLLIGIYNGTGETAMADTLALPPAAYALLMSTLMPDAGGLTLLDWIKRSNVLTAETQQTLAIVPIAELATAGAGGTSRAVAYRNAQESVVVHMPMPFRFFPVWQTGPWLFDVPGAFRMGGVEFKLPREATYLDGV